LLAGEPFDLGQACDRRDDPPGSIEEFTALATAPGFDQAAGMLGITDRLDLDHLPVGARHRRSGRRVAR
jgi:hypothetical protein